MVYVIRPADRAAFKRCRRAWDLSSPQRQGYEPVAPVGRGAVDLAQALIDALDVYYFPGMWTWDRSVVRPLVLQGLQRSLEEQHTRQGREGPGEAMSRERLDELIEQGSETLRRYFEWAAEVDSFEPLQVGGEFDAPVPDPADPHFDLPGPAADRVRYRGRVDVLVLDHDRRHWLVHHRLADEGWANVDDLRIEDVGATACWAWERCFLDVEIAGTIYNELRTAPAAGDHGDAGTPEGGAVRDEPLMVAGPWRVAHRHGDGAWFRRTVVPRERTEIDAAGVRLGSEAADMVDPSLRVYPAPSPAICAACQFRAPCVAMNDGSDVQAVLQASYRRRDSRDRSPGRLGRGGWMMGRGAAPPNFGRHDDADGDDARGGGS